MRAVFISYRRDDSEGHAGRIFDDLTEQFGAGAVFMDVAGLEPGRDFRRAIDQQVASCGVLLTVIGKGWLSVKNEAGQRRLDDPMDFVRLETATALKRDIPVVPVLVQGATMPRVEDLPEDLRDLAFRSGVQLTHVHWDSDIQILVKALRRHLQVAPAASPTVVPTAAAPTAATPTAVAPIAAASAQPKRWRVRPVIAVVAGVLVAAVAVLLVTLLGVASYLGSAKEGSAEDHASPTGNESMTSDASTTGDEVQPAGGQPSADEASLDPRSDPSTSSLVGSWGPAGGQTVCVFTKDEGEAIEGRCFGKIFLSGSYESGDLARFVLIASDEKDCVSRVLGELKILSDDEIQFSTQEWNACGRHGDPMTERWNRLAG